jgi:hypothetical protein
MPESPSDSGPQVTCAAHVLTRNWLPPGIALAVGVASMAALFAGVILAFLPAGMAFVFAIFAVSRNAYPRALPVELRASAKMLEIDGEPAMPVEDIAQARILRTSVLAVTMVVELVGGERVVFRLAPDKAEAIVRTLGVAAGARRTSFAVMTAVTKRFALPFACFAAWIAYRIWVERAQGDMWKLALLTLVVFGIPLSGFVAWLLGNFRARLVVGADGFTTRFFGRERFYPFKDVLMVRAIAPPIDPRPVVTAVLLRSGARLHLVAPERPVSDADRGAESRALHAHLDAAFERWKSGGAAAGTDASALFARGASTAAEWLARIDAIGRDGGARYRVAAPSAEVLARIAGDAASSSEVRVGAAAALARSGVDGKRAVRVAADACADPALRAALTAIGAAESDDEYVAALAPSENARVAR